MSPYRIVRRRAEGPNAGQGSARRAGYLAGMDPAPWLKLAHPPDFGGSLPASVRCFIWPVRVVLAALIVYVVVYLFNFLPRAIANCRRHSRGGPRRQRSAIVTQ